MSVRGLSRRSALQTLSSAAGLPFAGLAQSPARRVGIVGAGMAGVSLAWLLDGVRDVVLVEAAPDVGGNVRTASVDLGGKSYAVDLGAQYFHPGPYPTYVKLLESLGLYPSPVYTRGFAASITLDAAGEPVPRFVSPVIPDRAWPLLPEWNRSGLQAFSTAFAAAKDREQRDASWALTMGDWLKTLGLSSAQTEGMLLPWAASLFSGSIEQARSLSARAAMVFAAKALPDNPLDPIVYYVLTTGMIEPMRRMLQQTSTVELLTASPVSVVERVATGGFSIHCSNGQVRLVDDLVFATPAEVSHTLVRTMTGTTAQQIALAGIEFHDARLALHTDAVYAPAGPAHRSFLNCRVSGAFCEASMWMADVLDDAPSPASKLWKSWVTHRSQQPAQIVADARFRHMLPTPRTIASQAALAKLQGTGGIWFAGGYTFPYDSQETALQSAMRIASGLQAVSARTRSLSAR
jgi:uncharacterized protein